MVTLPRAKETSATAAKSMLIAVVGNPNCGKTTLFNALTGLRQKVGNYPGVTVEKREGVVAGEPSLRLLDLPGTYSLCARSLDEQITRDVLLGRLPDTPRPDAVLIVVDSTNLERNLFLATQVIELGLPAVIACNVMDLLEQGGHALDVQKLSAALRVPVVPTVAHRGRGLDKLRSALKSVCTQAPVARPRLWRLSKPLESEIAQIASAMTASGFADGASADGAALLWLNEGRLPERNHLPPSVRDSISAAFHRLDETEHADVSTAMTVSRYDWLGKVVDSSLRRSDRSARSTSDRLDQIFTHKFWGMLTFAGMMACLFYSIFVLAGPLMQWIETGVGWTQDMAGRLLPPGALLDLVRNGIIAGVGNVIVFFPQICILFLFIALLEDTGYMARAAFLMDRIMSRVGLHGKSFIPLLSSHACAIPGIMAARTIESPKDRLATILVAPLMSCSARLPVYTVLIAACLPGSAWTKAGVMLSMYALGITAALTMATLFKKTLLRGPTPAFILELPPYRIPRPFAVVRVMWDRSKLFLTRAGTVILAITIVLWALMNFPKSSAIHATYEAKRQALAASGKVDDASSNPQSAIRNSQSLDAAESAEQLQHSFAGRLGHFIEPAIKPLGYDWKIGIGIIASFAAREVFVGTMGIVYSVGKANEESTPLREQIAHATWPDGTRVYTPLVAIGLMVFYVLACQCVCSSAGDRRETNSWRWPLFMFTYMSVLAYVGALAVYQIGSALHIGTT